ncbi:hypothetical protein [Haloarcula onubensis]|uniref:Uncharacterized protein n=1 Tax=Haloarcula onubensis TaxID=2950539 RepID=A0ABU2FVD3_9EURY|nr:hypothetical protein [Halomicroarcula sp. S3CR25-11]MDS0284724.1 hypothetical protein [Halomicroarcula sp. S3CR25-11]
MTDDLDEDDVRAALSAVESEAADHGGDYRAGMRNARSILESELLG